MRIAFIGNFFPNKGSLIFSDILRRSTTHHWFIFGKIVDKPNFLKIKKYIALARPFEDGEIPNLLSKNKIDLVLLLSTVPETFSKTFFEIIEAGTPTISFGQGFPGYQFPNYSGFVSMEKGAQGIMEKINQADLDLLKKEIKIIKEEFTPKLKESSQRKFEAIDKILNSQ